jgi:hypothetical protein
VCLYDTIGLMDTRVVAALLIFAGAGFAAQTPADEPVTVSSEHPRLFLRPARLRLLKREQDRTSARWQQLELFIAGRAPMPEPGFADALYYSIAGDEAVGRRAVTWALGRDSDLRQQALVFDWCQPVMTDTQKKDLAARIVRGITQTAADESVPAVRSRALGAIAVFDHVPQVPQRELERVVHAWWERKIVPALKSGRNVIPRDDSYAFFELLHAIRDNTNIDLRESDPPFFKDFPIEHLMSYYPPPYPGPDSEYYIGIARTASEPDLRIASLSRAADLAMVAYDTNAPDSQILQGFAMHDRFLLKGTFGAPYEFLWANPYQPGLSYTLAPLVYYNPDFGRLFVRSSWEENARWFGYFDGMMQVFEDGAVKILTAQKVTQPISLEEAVILVAHTARKFKVSAPEGRAAFLVGLEPHHTYQIEIDDEEMYEAAADTGGIIEIEVPHEREVGVRLAEPRNSP